MTSCSRRWGARRQLRRRFIKDYRVEILELLMAEEGFVRINGFDLQAPVVGTMIIADEFHALAEAMNI